MAPQKSHLPAMDCIQRRLFRNRNMLWKASAIREYTIQASDGEIGTVKDLLFDDRSWTGRWVVVDTGPWLFGRKVLLPVSVLGKPDHDLRHLTTHLTKQQVKDSPSVN